MGNGQWPLVYGLWVLYIPKGQVGRIKQWNDELIFVVYHCDNQWENFSDYTAAGTKAEDLVILNEAYL